MEKDKKFQKKIYDALYWKENEKTKKHTGGRSILSHKTGLQIHKVQQKRNEKHENGISFGMSGL